MFDPEKRPLLSIPSLSTKVIFSKGLLKTPTLNISAPTMNLTAVVLSNLTETNWSQLRDYFPTDETPPPDSETKHSDPDLKPHSFYDYSLSVSAPKVTLLIEPHERLLPTVRLPPLHITSKQVGNAAALANLADDLVARVFQDNGVKSFPSKFRKMAKYWVHQSSSGPLNNALSWGQHNIDSLRVRMKQVDDATKDLPGLQQSVQTWTKKVQDALDIVQGITKVNDGNSNSQREREADNKSSPNLVPHNGLEGQFRELDE